jgi:DNA topoisomerase I
VARELNADEQRLYELIWQRTVASQMTDARGQTVSPSGWAARASSGDDAEFAASGTVITIPGFRRVYVEGQTTTRTATPRIASVRCRHLEEGDRRRRTGMEAKGHETQPPARFTEASLVKKLEELGVGRPSTYASIMGTIQDRGYVWKKGSALVPSFVAFAVVNLLKDNFERLVDYDFTARMEDDLDDIASGDKEAVPWLSKFYFGNGQPGLKAIVSDRLEEIDAREVNSIPLGKDAQGREIVARVGRYGPYLQRGDDRASIPEDIAPDELSIERATELLEAPSEERVLGQDPGTGLDVIVKSGRYGPYVQLGEMEEGSKEKPRTASLFKSMEIANVTLDDALKLLTIPREIGRHPDDDEPVEALNGRYGPYIKKGSDTRSLTSEEQIFTITLEEALALLAQPKQRGRRAAAPPLKELGPDPETKLPLVIRDGRFGPYVTDGEYNASVPRGMTPETITLEKAAEMMAEKRAAGPPKKRKKTTRKKSTKKKTAAKKTSKKKTTAKKTTKPKE